MSFDQRWEEIFAKQSWGKYPSEEVIRFIARTFYKNPDRKSIKILDLGCGGGATSWFLSREGFDCYAIDGSASAIKQCEELLKQDGLKAHFSVGDFQKLDFANETFDAICDLNSVQHNDTASIKKVHNEIHRTLKKGGYFFSMCLNDFCSIGKDDKETEPRTYPSLSTLNHGVTTHLFNKDDIQKSLKNFQIEKIERITREHSSLTISHYLVTARK